MNITEKHKKAVIDACVRISKARKKPSTALVKKEVAMKLPLALIIEGVNYFTSNSDLLLKKAQADEAAKEKSTNKKHDNDLQDADNKIMPCSGMQTCTQCQIAIANLQSEIEQIKSALKDLRSKVEG